MKGQPRLAKQARDQCEAITLEASWKRERGIDLRCLFTARFAVEKKRLCLRHAYCEALALAIAKGSAKPIHMPIRRDPYQPVKVVTMNEDATNASSAL